MSTRDKRRTRPRPARPVELPSGDTVHVRDLTVAELLLIDALAAEVPEGDERTLRYLLLFPVLGLVEPDGSPWYTTRTPADLADVGELFTPADLAAVGVAVAPSKVEAKNG